jgi:prepilin-type processing-associated H-X9-DG protein
MKLIKHHDKMAAYADCLGGTSPAKAELTGYAYNYFDRDAYRGGLYAIHQDKANISFSDGHGDSAAYHQGPDFNLSFIDKNLNIYSEYGRWEQQIPENKNLSCITYLTAMIGKQIILFHLPITKRG